MKGIPIYTEINDLHQLTGSAIRTQNPLFQCFKMQDADDMTVDKLPPHRVTFYTLALSFGTKDLSFTLNDKTFDDLDNFVLCVAPGQIAQWEKRDNWFGYCTFFKMEYLNFTQATNFLERYPFFNINETNLFPVSKIDFEPLRLLFEQILLEQNKGDKFGQEIIQSHFQAILWKVRRIYEAALKQSPSQKAASTLAAQFQYLVNEHFLQITSVEEYAKILGISANHLSQTIMLATGRKAKSIIMERRLNEAKYLLQYTNEQINEIAYFLNFSGPTHFIKFFKKETMLTPLSFRKLKHDT